MKLSDFNLLQKTMMQTNSESDGEALNAVRAANKILARNNVTWEHFFKRQVSTEVEPAPQDHVKGGGEPPIDAERLNRAFTKVLDDVKPGSFRDTVLDIHAKWLKNNYLSIGQQNVIYTAESRIGRPR